MVISKKTKADNVTACTDVGTIDPRGMAVEHIEAAIKSLASASELDEIAKESIANLAVVLVDLS